MCHSHMIEANAERGFSLTTIKPVLLSNCSDSDVPSLPGKLAYVLLISKWDGKGFSLIKGGLGSNSR